MAYEINKLIFKRLGIHTQHNHFTYLWEDCNVYFSEGLEAFIRICITNGKKSILANLPFIRYELLLPAENSLSERAITIMGKKEMATITLSHQHPITSLNYVLSKPCGNVFSTDEIKEIVQDIFFCNRPHHI